MDRSAKDCLVLFDTSVGGRLEGGWAQGVLCQRTKTVKAGPMVYVESYPVWDCRTAQAARSEAKREAHRKAQEALNRKRARKKLDRLVNANFGQGDLIITCTYGHGKQPQDDEAAARDIRNYMSRIKYRRKRLGLPEMKYIYVTEITVSAAYGVRYHHHVIMSGGIGRDQAEAAWSGKHGGICNAKICQPTERHLTGFSRYLTADKRERTIEADGKNPQRKMRRAWTPSKNLVDPDDRATIADKKVSIRKAGRIAEAVNDFERAREILEKAYPGCRLLEVSVRRSSWTAGVYICAEMRRMSDERDDGGDPAGLCGDRRRPRRDPAGLS